MDHYVRKVSHEFRHLDAFEDTSKLLIVIGILLFSGVPLTVIGIFTLASFT